METLLIAVTTVSLGVALAMSVVAWRAFRDQKGLAAARVAALAAAAQVPAAPEHQLETTGLKSRRSVPPTSHGSVLDVDAERVDPTSSPWRNPSSPSAETGQSSFTSEGAVRSDGPVVPSSTVAVQSGFLAAEPAVHESQTHQRWLAAAAALLAVVLGGFVYLRMSVGSETVAAQVQAASFPLELLSLRHERVGVNLSVAGLVRNPATGPMVERLTAVVYLFDQQGTFVTSAKAPIDFLKLTAGDESPFVVKVAAPQSVARYRVSFRTDDGTLPHVDRRGEPPITAPVALTKQ